MGAIHSLYTLRRLRQRLYWSEDQIEELRARKLRALLEHCYHRIPFYQEHFKKLGATPKDFHTPDDLIHLPIVEKSQLRDHPEEFFDVQADKSELMRYSSSGSTGIPLELWYHPGERQRMGFTMTREFLFHGLKPYQRLVTVTEPRHSTPKNRWYHRLGIMNEKFLSIYDPPEENLDSMLRVDPHLLIGFPSVLLLIGREMQKRNGKQLRPRWLFTVAEVLTNQYRDALTEQWGVAPIDVYGSNETGHIAFQCSQRSGYHINVDSVHVEVVANDKPVKIGGRGEIVVTNFDLRVMPIVRYRVGDVVQLLPKKCSCSCQFPLLGEIAGRSDGFIVGSGGKLFSALEVSFLLHTLKGILHYRILQPDANKIIVEWVPRDSNVDVSGDIESALKPSMGDWVNIEIKKVAEIPREKSGKIRSVISSLPSPY